MNFQEMPYSSVGRITRVKTNKNKSMRITFNKALLMGGYLLMTVAVAGAFTACSDDDDEELTAIQSPSVENSAKTVSSLNFTWSKVANATQYSYELTDPDGNIIDGDVTSGNTASFTGLKDNTTYTLSVWAYSAVANGVYGDAPVAVLQAKTDAIVPLPAPQNVQVYSHTGKNFCLMWSLVDNAGSYTYTLKQGDTVIETNETSDYYCYVNVPENGDYEFSIMAHSAVEAYSDSPETTISFTKNVELLWTAAGQMSNGSYKWDVNLEAYDDQTYALKSWYGYEDCDITFSVNEAGEMVPVGYLSVYGDYYEYSWSPTGTTYICTKDGWSSFSGDKNSGSLSFYCYGTYTFVWPKPLEVSLIDQLVGTYSEVTSGGDQFTSDWSWQNNISYTQDAVTVTKVDDTTLLMTGFYDGTSSLKLTVDQTAGTVKIAAGQTIAGYYTLAQYYSGANHPDEAIEVGYDLETGKLTIPKDGDYSSWKTWTTYYASQYYSYGFYVSTLTKK